MAKNFFERLRLYYVKVAEVLRGEADAASIFPNTTDIGVSRELIYAEFLKQHAPSKCNVFLGGFLFDEDGAESKQLDILITTDTTPRFNFHNKDGAGKSFSPVEGTLGVVSVKSTLNQAELFDALGGIASIPPTRSLEGRISFTVQIPNYSDWPVKIIYASKGISPETLMAHLTDYYVNNPQIPIARRPNFIHVAGSCLIIRMQERMTVYNKETGGTTTPTIGSYHLFTNDSDLQAIVLTLNSFQEVATASGHINFSYGSLMSKVFGI